MKTFGFTSSDLDMFRLVENTPMILFVLASLNNSTKGYISLAKWYPKLTVIGS